ncbi:hypothetical protein [Dyadobacter sp. CY312]|uniref:hypothetical protein n=1 Tax=Dyadobacter sp. CY312 TaxID=2907303 RepID=UPI001F19269F|nr:hypothetical protein [Dyadobacter sp. CY312]MCE7039226.1 hypothetical protein [Dyadobacter sp. CY312]
MKSNIYISLALKALEAPDKGMYFLSFLKVRTVARKRAGTFTEQMFMDVANLNKRTARTHLIKMILGKYVEKVGIDKYKICTQRSQFDGYTTEYIYQISDEVLLAYSWRNIASFRSLLAEIIISRNRKHRQSARKNTKYNKSQLNLIDGGFDLRVSLAYGKALTGLSMSTLSKYRKRQTVSDYQYNLFVYPDAEEAMQMNEVQEKIQSLKGKHFVHRGKLVISEISIRLEKTVYGEEFIIKPSRIKSSKQARKNTSGILFHKPCIV